MAAEIIQGGLPQEAGQARAAIYNGAIFKCAASPASRALVQTMHAAVQDVLGHDITAIHERASFAEVYPLLTKLRGQIAASQDCRDAMGQVMAALGFTDDEFQLDDLRLRCVMNNGHLNAGSAKAYALHRDTWYGNPQSQINFWIPLHDVDVRNAFTFYPDYFNRAIDNTSHGFNFLEWIEKTGWQGSKNVPDNDYPRATARPESGGSTFSASAGDVIVFSAAHLHETTPNASGLTRFSLDFRAVHKGDHAQGLGAPNADNGSAPDALRGYR